MLAVVAKARDTGNDCRVHHTVPVIGWIDQRFNSRLRKIFAQRRRLLRHEPGIQSRIMLLCD